MYDKLEIAVVGYSGHAFVVLDAATEMGFAINYYTEKSSCAANPFALEYIGDEGNEFFDWSRVDAFVLGIGDNQIRKKIAHLIQANNKEFPNVIHPSAVVSKRCQMGIGNFIGARACINTFSQLGSFCILNTGCIVEHECVIEDAVHIAPGAVLAGHVQVGKMTFIGANAVVKQGITIGENVIIGAGSTVICHVPDNEVWAGNPAKKLK